MKQFEFPLCKQQKSFEDTAKTLIKTLAELDEDEQTAVLEYAMKLAYESKEEKRRYSK